MTLRSKILLAQLPLAAALLAVGVAGALVAASLERDSDAVLRDNYQSVIAAQRMGEALERVDSGALFIVIRDRAPGRELIAKNIPRFERELRVEEGNITEPGEAEAAAHLRATWTDYRGRIERFQALSEDGEALRAAYHGDVYPAFTATKAAVDKILTINQDSMVLKSQRAERRAARYYRLLIASAVICSLLGLFGSATLTTRLMRPLGVLGHAVRRLGKGDVRARASVTVRDEIGQLAADFNAMAEHLEQYRSSSLGELLVAQREAQAVIDSLSDPVIVIGTKGEILNVNTAAETFIHVRLESEDPLGRVDSAVRGSLERVRNHVASGRGAFTPKGFEDALRVLTSDGERSYLPRATPLYSEEGAIVGATIVLQDVTRLLRFDELRNDLVATVAHEFRTPLTSLRLAIHMCTEGAVGPLNDKQSDLLFAARDDCERLQSIVDDLLDLSRIQAGRIELHARDVSAETLVAAALDVHRAAAEEKGVTLRAETLPGVGEVLADPDRLELVFTNLVDNAIRHTPAGGEVVVAAQPVDHGVRFEVRDTGTGIPLEYRGAIFEKFYRIPGAPSGGAGLGLYIAREIVQAHEGEIGFDSEPGKGTTFWFRIPSAPESVA